MEGFEYSPKQFEALKLLNRHSEAKHVMLYGGSRSGKTFLLTINILHRAIQYKGSRHAIIRHRYNAVKQAVGMDTLPSAIRARFPWLKYNYNRSEGVFRIDGGSEIWLLGLDDVARVEKILGKEFATVYFNECSQIEYPSVEVALTRLAQNVPGLVNKAFYDCNPPGKSHWSYRLFIQKINPTSRKALTNPRDYDSMVINPTDNPFLSDDYVRNTLGNLSTKAQERFLNGRWQDDTDGALWTQAMIDNARVVSAPDAGRIVVAIDPAVTTEDGSDFTGIVVVSVGRDGEYYVLEDASCKADPVSWCKVAVELYHKYHADRIIGEANNGGDMIEALLRQVDRNVSYRKVWASRGKAVRAEPIAAIYEKGKVHHVGEHVKLEEEMTSYVPNMTKVSPNRMDALVWGMTELAKGGSRIILA